MRTVRDVTKNDRYSDTESFYLRALSVYYPGDVILDRTITLRHPSWDPL